MSRRVWYCARHGVPGWIRSEVRKVLSRLLALSPPTKVVSIQVVPYGSVSWTAGHVGWGALVVQRGRRARIYIAGDLSAAARKYKLKRDELREIIGETLCHEWAHYEQYRDGRPLIERGVAVRAKNLYAMARKPVAPSGGNT